MIHCRWFDGRFMYIGDLQYDLIVIDIEKGIENNQGGLYLCHFMNSNPEYIDMSDDRSLKIIGVDMV